MGDGRGYDFTCWCPGCGGMHIIRFADRPSGELIELCEPCRIFGFDMRGNGDLYRKVRTREKTREQMLEEYKRAIGCVGGERGSEEENDS